MSSWGKFSLLLTGCSLIIAAGTRFILGGWGIVSYIFLAFFAAGLLATLILDYKFYLEILTAKATKNSMSLGWSLLLVIIGLSAAGYFGHRFNQTFDLTEEKINSLAPQTEKALESLKEDLTLYILYKGDKISERARFAKEDLKNKLTLYKQKTTKFKTRLADIYKSNALAERFNLSDLPDKNEKEMFVFVEYEGRHVRVTTPFNERSITSAIIKVKNRTVKEIYFLIGHGEKDPEDDRPDGLKIFQQGLMDSGLTLKEWSFVQEGAPTKDPAVLLVIGSRRPWLDKELNWVKDYLKRGGRVFMALDPGEKHNLQPFLKEYGIDYKDNFILSLDIWGRVIASIYGAQFDASHPITSPLKALKNVPADFSKASVVEVADLIPEEWEASRLVRTNDANFTVPELKEFTVPELREKLKKAQSLTVAIEVKPKTEEKKDLPPRDPHDSHRDSESEEEKEKEPEPSKEKKKGFRLVVFGDSDFLTNRNIYKGVNRDLALNSVISLVDEEDLITTIRPKQAKGTKINLTDNHKIGLITMVIIPPVMFFILSLWIWFRRREA